jgi:hypothetical protein
MGEKEKVTSLHGSMGVDIPVECDAFLKTAAQVGPNVLVCCHDEFAMTVQFPWLDNSELHHRDLLLLVNKKMLLHSLATFKIVINTTFV